MSVRVRKQDNIVPATDSFDFDIGDDVLFDSEGPYFVAFQYWVSSVDPLASGGFVCDVFFTDPTNTERQINGGAISLADSTAYFDSPARAVVRLDKDAMWQFRTTLAGDPGSTLISYRVECFPAEEIYDWPV